jgi:hypothetical protein
MQSVVRPKKALPEGDLAGPSERRIKGLAGDGPVEKHILLVKLKDALQRAPNFGEKPTFGASSPQRQWFAEVGALLARLGLDRKMQYRASFNTLAQYWKPAVDQIMGQVLDAIEELKHDLELDGRTDIGSAYAPGETYRFFADLKAVVASASSQILVVDPYFNGEAFDAYLSGVTNQVAVRVLADKYVGDISAYVCRFNAQYGERVELRASNELHDRLVFVDVDEAWIMGGSIKDAGKKATYLIPLAGPIVEAKRGIYEAIWIRAAESASRPQDRGTDA